jgi:hypothetical protein
VQRQGRISVENFVAVNIITQIGVGAGRLSGLFAVTDGYR